MQLFSRYNRKKGHQNIQKVYGERNGGIPLSKNYRQLQLPSVKMHCKSKIIRSCLISL